MLRWRIILGTALVVAIAAWMWLDAVYAPAMLLFPLALLLTAAAAGEMIYLAAGRGLQPSKLAVYGGNLAIVGSNAVWVYWPLSGNPYPVDCPIGRLGWPLLALCGALAAATVVEMRRYRRPGETMERLALALFSFVYVGALVSMLVQLRSIEAGQSQVVVERQSAGPDEQGLWALLSLVVVVKLCDIGAYTFGRLFGRHKLAPTISPGKTIEGAIGGLALGVVGAVILFQFFHASPPPWRVAIYGLVLAAFGIVGDLAESLLKRDLGRKDSSRWLPGFGGVLDILDSLLLAAPAAYLFWAAGWFSG